MIDGIPDFPKVIDTRGNWFSIAPTATCLLCHWFTLLTIFCHWFHCFIHKTGPSILRRTVGWNDMKLTHLIHYYEILSNERSARAKWAMRSKGMNERCEWTTERMSEWPNILRVNFISFQPIVRRCMNTYSTRYHLHSPGRKSRQVKIAFSSRLQVFVWNSNQL